MSFKVGSFQDRFFFLNFTYIICWIFMNLFCERRVWRNNDFKQIEFKYTKFFQQKNIKVELPFYLKMYNI